MYKSPGIKGHQFKEGLDFLYEEMSGKDVDLVVAGDFNLKRLGLWTPIERSEMRTRNIRNKSDTENNGVAMQETLMMDLVEYYFLDQVVKEPTREEAILDLFFTNTGSVRKVETISNAYTDHKTVIVKMMGYDKQEEEAIDKGSHYLSRVKDYRYEELNEEGWAKVVSTFRRLSFKKFDELSPEEMEKILRDNVSIAIGENCEEKKKGGLGKKKIPKIYKRLFKKKKRIS